VTAGAAASRRLEARIAELEAELGMADRASNRRGISKLLAERLQAAL